MIAIRIWDTPIETTEWIRYPVCGNKIRNRVRKGTIMRNSPLYCPKCKHGTLVDIKQFIVRICKDTNE